MSRCFPYPPPGYIGSKAIKDNNDALIDSIKLQKEIEKAKAERKKEKKIKKKEKHEQKEKDKAKQYPYGAQDGKAHKSAPVGEAHKSALFGEALRSWADSKGTFKEKTRAEIDLQMERSGLTEEHQQPVSVHKPSHSSDSTENSHKRKRPASPSPSPSSNGGISGHGNILRIKLPLRKHKEPKLDKEPICSTSGRTELAGPLPKVPPPFHGRTIEEEKRPIYAASLADQVFNPVQRKNAVKAPFCSTSGNDQVSIPAEVPIPVLTAFEKEMQAASLFYKELVDKLPIAPPSELFNMDDDDDEDWLFSRKKQNDRQEEKRHKPSSDSCRGSSLMQPIAQFLPEVGVYALPYTLPF